MPHDFSFKMIRFFDKFFIFTRFLEKINFIHNELKIFFHSKSLGFNSYLYSYNSNQTVSHVLRNRFFVSPYKIIFLSLTNKIRLLYLQKLKNFVKSSFRLSISDLIISLNRKIDDWVITSSFYFDTYQKKELDLYLYKLLWKFFKRCHPRRPNTWIYSKYWKVFSGVQKVFAFDNNKGKFYFLKSHCNFRLSNYCLPLLLHPFNKMSQKKLFSALFKRSRTYFCGPYRILFIKQKGLCFFCNMPLRLSNYRLATLNKNFYSQQVNSFVLLHTYC